MNNINRKKNRLSGYYYGESGYYFITICTQNKVHYFGEIKEDRMMLSKVGKIVYEIINNLEKIYTNVNIDKYVIMPNHIHLILILDRKDSVTISNIINQFKGAISRKIGYSPWQKSYYDHIIRNEKDYYRIWKYIDTNILKWIFDKYY